MANLILSTKCNLDCKYCFAQIIKKEKKETFFSKSKLNIAIHYLKEAHDNIIQILGGEPTLHPKFMQLYNLIEKKGFYIKVFTNGLFSNKITGFLKAKKNLDLIFNVNRPSYYSIKEWDHLIKNIFLLRDKASLACTVYDDKQDMNYLIDIFRKNKLSRYNAIRIGIANPIYKGSNVFLDSRKIKTAAKKIVAFSKKCSKYNIALSLDCGFSLCAFKKNDVAKLFFNTATEIKNIKCHPVLDILPSLEVCYCLALSDKAFRAKLTDFESIQQITDYFRKKFKGVIAVGNFRKCFKCILKERDQCSGGCLSRTIKNIYLNESKDE